MTQEDRLLDSLASLSSLARKGAMKTIFASNKRVVIIQDMLICGRVLDL